MGVYSNVHMCLQSDAPLRPDLRVLLVKIAIHHEVLYRACSFAVPKPAARSELDSFGSQGLAAYAGVRAGDLVDVLERGAAGDWLSRRAAEARTGFIVGSEQPKWAGETIDGGFMYVAVNEPVEVRIVDGYSDHPNPDGEVVGSFFDVLTLSSNRGLDGYQMAETDLAHDIRALTGMELACHTTWW